MVNESITFGYLRRNDIMYADGETLILFHVMCNNGESKIYEIDFECRGSAKVYYNRVCSIIDARIVRNRYAAPGQLEPTYITCTIKKRNNIESVVFEGRDDTECYCSALLENYISREQCIETINDLILHH